MTSVLETEGNKMQPSYLPFPAGILWRGHFLPQSDGSQEFSCSMPLSTFLIYYLIRLSKLLYPKTLSLLCKDSRLGLLFRKEVGFQPH